MKNLKNLGFIGAGTLGAVAVTFGAAGIAGAQDADPELVEPDVAEESTEDAGENEGRRGNRGRGFRGLNEDRVAQLIEDGVITEEQAEDLDAIRAAVQEQREAMRAEKQQAIADVLGITVEDLEAAREEGQTLAEIAGDNVDALVDYFVEQKTEKINEKVAAGELTQEEADEKIAGLEERIESRIENGGGFGRRGFNGPRDGGPAGADATAETTSA